MKKTELPRVQQRAVESRVVSPVDRISAQRVAKVLQMNADLVRSPGPELAVDQAAHGQPLSEGKRRPGGPAARRDGHLLALYRVAADRGRAIDRRSFKHAAADPEVPFDHLAPGKLAAQLKVNRIGLRDHQTAGGVFVQPVHDARSRLAAHPAQWPRPSQQSVDERARREARSRVNRHARRLVHHQQVLILVDDRDGDGFGNRRRRLR
ncbi:MAG: hypothetical protein JO069_00435 [Verrucomicrobia bacterium]|nr:hypothetical protein [Verrucomicrobiota bacterium]